MYMDKSGVTVTKQRSFIIFLMIGFLSIRIPFTTKDQRYALITEDAITREEDILLKGYFRIGGFC